MKLIPNSAWQLLVEQIAAQREDLRKAQERIDRLTEALSYRSNVPLVMPQAELPKIQAAPVPEEPSGTWFGTKPIPAVIPNSGGKSK